MRTEAELAAFPEINKRSETDQLMAQVLARALEREAWFECQQADRPESSASSKRGKRSGSVQILSEQRTQAL